MPGAGGDPPVRYIHPFGSDPQGDIYQHVAHLVAESQQSGQPVGDLFTFQGQRVAIIVGTDPEQMDPFRGYIRPPANPDIVPPPPWRGNEHAEHPFDPRCMCMRCGEEIARARRAEQGGAGE